ncbi:hypothetical protein N752_11285 [Desulforamulus aquiferis]|nr:hypothetical protein N752_11285 [Desulforamulus aquiferis]
MILTNPDIPIGYVTNVPDNRMIWIRVKLFLESNIES